MKMSSDDAREMLREIIVIACRMTGANLKDYEIEIGTDLIGSPAAIDWCLSIQNKAGYMDTKEVKESGLTRRVFRVYQQKPEDAVNLCILEWSAENDTGKSYRETWSKDASDLNAREEMAHLFADSIRSLL